MLALMLCLFAADTEPIPEIKVLAKGQWRHARPNGQKTVVIRKAEELANLLPYSNLDAPPAAVGKMAAADLAADLKVKEIDFTKQMAIILLAGMKGSGGYSVEVTGMKVVKGVLRVSWKLNAPKGFATNAITYPNLVVLVPRFSGKVEFDLAPAK